MYKIVVHGKGIDMIEVKKITEKIHGARTCDVEIFLLDNQVIYFSTPNEEFIGECVTRVSEYQESPMFNSMYFTLNEYKAWYKRQTNRDEFTYVSDWHGWNFSSKTLEAFNQTFDDPANGRYLSDWERVFHKNMIDIVRTLYGLVEKKYYVIVTLGSPDFSDGKIGGLLKHEFTHAKFFLDDEYASAVWSAWDALGKEEQEKLKLPLACNGYDVKDTRLVVDESNAYGRLSLIGATDGRYKLIEEGSDDA